MKRIKDVLLEDNYVPEIVSDKAEEAFSMIREMKELNGEIPTVTKNNRGKRPFRFAKVAVVAACVSLLLGTSVYAANHYLNLFSFLSKESLEVPKETAKKLIDDEVSQQLSEGDSQLVEFKVQEALTDGDMVYLTVEARTKEKDKYFMIPDASMGMDILSDVGLDSDLTGEEYAKQQNMEALSVGVSIDGLDMSSQSLEYQYEDKDTILFFINGQIGRRVKKEDNLKASVVGCIMPFSMSTEEVMKKKEDFTSHIDFTLKNVSKRKGMTYTLEKNTIKGTTVEVTGLSVVETELATYVTIQYTEDEQELVDKGVVYRLKDKQGKILEETQDSTGVVGKGGNYEWTMQFDNGTIPDEFVIEAFDCFEDGKPVYDQIKVVKN